MAARPEPSPPRRFRPAQSSPPAAQLPQTSLPASSQPTKTERLSTLKLILEVLIGLVTLIGAILALLGLSRK